VIPQQLAAGPA
jgi:glutathione S-transferase